MTTENVKQRFQRFCLYVCKGVGHLVKSFSVISHYVRPKAVVKRIKLIPKGKFIPFSADRFSMQNKEKKGGDGGVAIILNVNASGH